MKRNGLSHCLAGVLLMLCLAAVLFAVSFADDVEARIGDDREDPVPSDVSSVDFKAQYIRTDGYHDGAVFPQVKIINSLDSLHSYYEANKSRFDLASRSDPASDSTVGFLDAVSRYDEVYFSENVLLMVLLEEGSGSVRHEVKSVSKDDEQVFIEIDTQSPEIGTCDMAEWHILIETKRMEGLKAENVTVYLDGVNPLTKDTVVRHSEGYANISLTLPHDWKYQLIYNENENSFCIAVSPKSEAKGEIQIWCNLSLGFCGTGLKEEKITLAGRDAYRGTYAGDPLWHYILFTDTPGDYVILNQGAELWWEEYENEAMKILNSVKPGEGIISKTEAERIAKAEAKIDYDTVDARFDCNDGIWTVLFHKKNVLGGSLEIKMTSEGKIIETVFGE